MFVDALEKGDYYEKEIIKALAPEWFDEFDNETYYKCISCENLQKINGKCREYGEDTERC